MALGEQSSTFTELRDFGEILLIWGLMDLFTPDLPYTQRPRSRLVDHGVLGASTVYTLKIGEHLLTKTACIKH